MVVLFSRIVYRKQQRKVWLRNKICVSFSFYLYIHICLFFPSIEVLRLCPKAQDWRWGRNSGIIISLSPFYLEIMKPSWLFLNIFHYKQVFLCRKKADSMILEFIFKHRFDLAHWHGLEDFKYNRHNTYFQKKCICQYLEPSLVSDSLL